MRIRDSHGLLADTFLRLRVPNRLHQCPGLSQPFFDFFPTCRPELIESPLIMPMHFTNTGANDADLWWLKTIRSVHQENANGTDGALNDGSALHRIRHLTTKEDQMQALHER